MSVTGEQTKQHMWFKKQHMWLQVRKSTKHWTKK